MAELLSNRFGKNLKVDLVPSSGGAFEISLDGNLVYSKLKTGKFPEEKDMEKIIATIGKSSGA